MICRPNADAQGEYFAVAFKGGNNAEMHNHNDVGSYSLILGTATNPKTPDLFVSRDPGGETYTARTFSAKRYEGELLNSYGHPVPKIAGKLQSSGGKAQGVVVQNTTSDNLDIFEIDFTSAYDVPTLKTLLRKFEYARASKNDSGYFKITDSVEFKDNAKETFETALVTFENAQIQEDGDALAIVVKSNGENQPSALVRVSAKDREGKSVKLVAEKSIVGENDPSVPKKPTRIAFRVDGATNGVVVEQLFTVNSAK